MSTVCTDEKIYIKYSDGLWKYLNTYDKKQVIKILKEANNYSSNNFEAYLANNLVYAIIRYSGKNFDSIEKYSSKQLLDISNILNKYRFNSAKIKNAISLSTGDVIATEDIKHKKERVDIFLNEQIVKAIANIFLLKRTSDINSDLIEIVVSRAVYIKASSDIPLYILPSMMGITQIISKNNIMKIGIALKPEVWKYIKEIFNASECCANKVNCNDICNYVLIEYLITICKVI